MIFGVKWHSFCYYCPYFSSESEESDSSTESEQENEEPVSSTVDPGVEVPSEIDTTSKSWLYRRSRTPSPKKEEQEEEKKKKKRKRLVPFFCMSFSFTPSLQSKELAKDTFVVSPLMTGKWLQTKMSLCDCSGADILVHLFPLSLCAVQVTISS